MSRLAKEVRQYCSDNLLRLNTDLGQHFLVDEMVLDEIVTSGDIQEDDHIVEIGPGIGVLTRELLYNAGKVTAVEIDERMISLLKQFTGYSSILTIINNDALKVDFPEEPYKIIANIPYHITSPLLRHAMMESKVRPTSMTLLIQKEVADRICDKKSECLLSIIVKLFGEPKKICNVPPTSFLPPPKVDSAVIHIECFKEPLTDGATIDLVMKYAKIGFSMKRKMLRNSFATFPEGLELLSAASIDETRRPQTLSVQEWIAVANASK
ncbi:ribosomal RNA small subunit methyltransferase A [Candidatus Peregrinibacteria bacterium]|nr:ribosomal RNA small subunit methyltransferase A [Candidatus Peregrinibacteria bacterium]